MAIDSAKRANAGLIDVHHHVVPPFYLSEYGDRIASSRGGLISPAWLEWTPEKALQAMDRYGIELAVISLSTPASGSAIRSARVTPPAAAMNIVLI